MILNGFPEPPDDGSEDEGVLSSELGLAEPDPVDDEGGAGELEKGESVVEGAETGKVGVPGLNAGLVGSVGVPPGLPGVNPGLVGIPAPGPVPGP
jgi:hypothetical protein